MPNRGWAGLAGLIAAGWLSAGGAPARQTAGFGPTLELEKQVYTIDEAIRFWVGVTQESETPTALHSSCVLHIIRPDGSRLDEHVHWPMDGDSSHNWKGGSGVGKPSLGRYIISFEFAGQRTANETFEVVPNPFSGSIRAEWTLGDAKSGGDAHVKRALLHVENKTGRVLRFAKPGLPDSDVSFRVRAFDPPSTQDAFVPQAALLAAGEVPSFMLDRLDWSNQSRWPMVEVADGGSVDRAVLLKPDYSFRDGQVYEITIHGVLTVFVGERDDPDARLFPLRIPVSGTARFRW
jgi:hypothetical protein